MRYTGSGKSTQIPQRLAYDEYNSGLAIACTQPRRLAATNVANRVAGGMVVNLGEEVGYRIGGKTISDRNEKKSRLVYMTEGVLVNRISLEDLLNRDDCPVQYRGPVSLVEVVNGQKKPIRPSRVLLVVSVSQISRISLQLATSTRLFQRDVMLCLRPSTIFYDEWTLAKGAHTNVMKALEQLVDPDVHGQFPIVALLGGTPMSAGLKDLRSTFSLIYRAPEHEIDDILQPIVNAHAAARKNTTPESIANLWHQVQTFWVDDIRPSLCMYSKLFVLVQPEHQTQVDIRNAELRARLRELENHDDGHISNLSEFDTALRLSVIPGTVHLLEEWLNDQYETASAYPRKEESHVYDMTVITDYESLRLFESCAVSTCASAQSPHLLVLTQSPKTRLPPPIGGVTGSGTYRISSSSDLGTPDATIATAV
ncbi:hypothetical protein B0I35DRAFT_481894 [Stachybotrys elegans]|uniref:Uncharacterized protein n=1 Tax=Stachybotrys elegans TaxID=80388 RepID=A0A8K0SPK7_9HYPO|nr:hypothetical protein B0I35DRAFT_481894 [Stachybotrys elegans]